MKTTKNKPEYISYKDVKKLINSNGLQYLLMIGQRSNGKSYAAKELAIRTAYGDNKPFTYLRRYKSSIKNFMVFEYFADMCVPDEAGNTAIYYITDGEYTTISVYQNGIYLANNDPETGKEKRGQLIGYAHALTDLETLKSRQFPNVKYILFEEFIATGLFLYDECNKLQQYVSTIFRNEIGTVIMIGNTISRIVPYFTEWCLDGIQRQEQGTTEVYNFKSGDSETRIGVFLCESLKTKSKMFFGQAAKMIVGGEWERKEMPHLQHDIDDYIRLHSMVFQYTEKATFFMTLLQSRIDPSNILWYVEPKTTPILSCTRVVSPKLNESPYYTSDFIPLNAREKKAFDLLRQDKIAYSDNLTGTEFKRCMEMLHVK